MTGVLLIAIVAGVIIGLLSGLLGIGGGTMIIPILRLGFGLTTIDSSATSLFAIVLTSISGGVGHIRNHTANIQVGLVIGLAGACFSPIGSAVSTHIGNLVTLLIEAAVFLYIAYTMVKKAYKMSHGAKKADQSESDIRRSSDTFKPANESAMHDASGAAIFAKEGKMSSEVREQEHHGIRNAHDAVLALFIGALAGFAAGMLGIGGGFIIVPLCIAVFGFSMNEASGTSLVAILPVAISGTIAHMVAGQVHVLYGLLIALGSIPGAYLGARLSSKVPERKLRYLFACILVCVTGILVLNELGLLG